MATARAFPYLRYNPDVTGDPGKLLAPPYDVITEEERAELATSSPYQSVLLELPEGGDNAAAGRLLRQWIDEDVLEAGEVGIAIVRQRFVGPDGVRRSRTSVLCEVGLRPFGDGILPHERTFDAPRTVRQDLMRETGANISPVFLLYHDPERPLVDLLSSITDEQPDFTSTDADGTQTAAWFVTDLGVLEQFEAAVEPHDLLIADGHHRYTAALGYRDEVRAKGPRLQVVGGTETTLPPHSDSAGVDGVLAFVANSADPGIEVFPTHRVVSGVDLRLIDEFVVGSGAFDVTDFDTVDAAMAALADLPSPGFVVHTTGRTQLFAVSDPVDLELAAPDTSIAYRSLDVIALHSLVLDGGAVLANSAKVAYTRKLDDALQRVADGGDGTVAFLVRGAPVETVHRVGEAGEVMPQKSTYYYPKVPTGVAFRLLEPLA